MAEKINIGAKEPLYKAAEKINNAMDEVNTAVQKSDEASVKSINAETTANSVQEQFNQVVIEGDSSVEAAQARVDADGVAHTTLKERLDQEHNEVTTRLAQTTLVSSDIVNIAESGCIADAIQIDYTYSGTGTTLDGKTRKIWISEGNNGIYNRNIIQDLLDEGKSIFVPEGDFYIDGLDQLVAKYSGLTVVGNNKEKSRLIGSSFGTLSTSAVSNILFRDVTLEGIADVTPPSKLKKGSDPDFDPLVHYDLYDDQSFVFIDGEYKTNATWGCFVYKHDPNIQTEGILFDNVIIRNYHSGLLPGNKLEVNPNKRVKNIRFQNCVFDNIVFQPVGANNVEDIETNGNVFKNIYFQPIDYAAGCIDARMLNNTFDNCGSLGKIEGTIKISGERILSDNFNIRGNRYINPPDINDVHYDEGSIISNLTGDGEVRDNYFEVGNRHKIICKFSPKYVSKHCQIGLKDNKVNIKDSAVGNLFFANVFKYDNTSSVKGIDLTLDNNKIVNNSANAEAYLATNYAKVRSIKKHRNEIRSTGDALNRLYDGYLPETKMELYKNEIDNVKNTVINFVTADMFSADVISILDNVIEYLPNTSLISTTAIMFNNSTSTNLSIGKVELLRNKINFPVVMYAAKADISEVSIKGNDIHVDTNQTDIGQSNIIYRTNGYTKKFVFERNEIMEGSTNLTFIPLSILSTGQVDTILIANNEIEEMEYFARTSNFNILVDLAIKGNLIHNSGVLTLVGNIASSNVKKGYFSGNIIEASTYNANYFGKIRDSGNIINATTINESNKVTA